MTEERVLDADTWLTEAEAAINDIRKHVAWAQVSRALRGCDSRVYINVTTLERAHYCVEMSRAGFRVVGARHDDAALASASAAGYETPYALLGAISRRYRESFGGELATRLRLLADDAER